MAIRMAAWACNRVLFGVAMASWLAVVSAAEENVEAVAVPAAAPAGAVRLSRITHRQLPRGLRRCGAARVVAGLVIGATAKSAPTNPLEG